MGAAFGYAVGWNPYASDYTRYLPPSASKRAIALWAGLGLFLSCVLLEIVGRGRRDRDQPGAARARNPTGAFTGLLPTPLADLTLLAIALGAVAANVLNIYSGALSFTALGIRLPLSLRRAIVALVFGAIGFVLALTGLHNAGTKYENFLLVIAYWIAPWLAVVFCDRLLRRRQEPREIEPLLFDKKYANWAGPVAMLVGMVVSIWLFSNQTEYIGVVPSARAVRRRPDVRGGLRHHRGHLPGLARASPTAATAERSGPPADQRADGGGGAASAAVRPGRPSGDATVDRPRAEPPRGRKTANTGGPRAGPGPRCRRPRPPRPGQRPGRARSRRDGRSRCARRCADRAPAGRPCPRPAPRSPPTWCSARCGS